MAGENGTADVFRSDDMSLKDLRATLTPAEKRMVRDSINHIESEMIVDLEKLVLGVRATRTQSSIMPRIALIPKGKKGWDIGLEVSSRISAKKKPFKADYHLDSDGQLALGFENADPDPDDGEAEGKGNGADKQPSLGDAPTPAPPHH